MIPTYMGTCIGHIQQGCQNHFVSAQCQNHFVLRQSSSDIPAVCSLCMYPCNIYSFHIFFFTVNWFLLEKSNVGDPSHCVFRGSYRICSPVQPLRHWTQDCKAAGLIPAWACRYLLQSLVSTPLGYMTKLG